MTFTPDQKWIVFRSNMHGATHVYAVEIAKPTFRHVKPMFRGAGGGVRGRRRVKSLGQQRLPRDASVWQFERDPASPLRF